MNAWVFKRTGKAVRQAIYGSIKAGKSRYFSQHDVQLQKKRDCSSSFLLDIDKDDWIVHLDCPAYQRCVAVQAVGGYGFDDGLMCPWGRDFQHYIPVDPATMVEFDRGDKGILPTLNLNAHSRYPRIFDEAKLLDSLENVRQHRTVPAERRTEELRIEDKTEAYFKQIASLIYQTHNDKQFEQLLGRVFRQVPGVTNVYEAGLHWKGNTRGGDLIVLADMMGFEYRIVVHARTFEGRHDDLDTPIRMAEAMQTYDGHAGMIFTTAESTDELEHWVQNRCWNRQVSLVAGADVAKFILRYAPEVLLNVSLQ